MCLRRSECVTPLDDPRASYANPHVQARIAEYCGASGDRATCAFVSELGPGRTSWIMLELACPTWPLRDYFSQSEQRLRALLGDPPALAEKPAVGAQPRVR